MSFFDSFEAAIFDLDGTLLDSMPLWENFCGNWLISLGKIPGAGLETDIVSMTASQSAEYIKRHYNLDFSPEELIAQWGDAMLPHYLKRAPLKQGVAELIGALASRGMKLGVATYSFPRCTEAILLHHKIFSCFSLIFYAHEAQDSGIASVKKTPEFWLSVAAKLNISPEKCIVFEDSLTSVTGIRAAGMGLAAVYDATCENWPTLSNAADLTLNYPGEALAFL